MSPCAANGGGAVRQGEAERQPAHGMRVLVIDDHRETADAFSTLLTLLGCITAVAYDGATAISLLAVFRPDVMMLDIEMPRLNGLEVARRIRTQCEHQPMMMVAVTGWSTPEARHCASRAGFDEFVSKPINIHWLTERLAFWQTMVDGAPEKEVRTVGSTRAYSRRPEAYSLTAPRPSQEGCRAEAPMADDGFEEHAFARTGYRESPGSN